MFVLLNDSEYLIVLLNGYLELAQFTLYSQNLQLSLIKQYLLINVFIIYLQKWIWIGH